MFTNELVLNYMEDSGTVYHNVICENVRACKESLKGGFKLTALSMITNIEWETTDHEFPWAEGYPATLA